MHAVSSVRQQALARIFVLLTAAGVAGACRSAGPHQPTLAPAATPLPVHHVIPEPATIHVTPSAWLTLGELSRIVVANDTPAVRAVAELLAGALRPATGFAWPLSSPVTGARASAAPAIVLAIDPEAGQGPEAYRLDVRAEGIELRAPAPEGLFRGVQTLRMLLPAAIHAASPRPGPWRVPFASITDAPRFSWRGAMLDVARHFFDAAQVKRYVDLLALYKFNVLHLHLSDDQGWRITIDAWPDLTAVGGSTGVNGDRGGFYTKAQYREIVDYAAARFITVVPEIDMPGHTNAALASYPELNCDDTARALYTGIKVGFSALCVGREVTFRFIEDVIGELAAMTPGAYLHIGGDEVKLLSPADYASFVERVEAIVARHGKKAIGWEEVAHATLAPTTVVQHWRAGSAGAVAAASRAMASAIAQGAPIVMSPASKVYLDMKYDAQTALGLSWAGYVDVRDAYDWDPAAMFAGVTGDGVLGVEAPLWTETILTMDDLEWMALPRLPAVAEVGWSAQEARTWASFRGRVGLHGLRWDAMGVRYYRSPQVAWIGSAPSDGPR